MKDRKVKLREIIEILKSKGIALLEGITYDNRLFR